MAVRRHGRRGLLHRVADVALLVPVRGRGAGDAVLFSRVALPASPLALGWSAHADGELCLRVAAAGDSASCAPITLTGGAPMTSVPLRQAKARRPSNEGSRGNLDRSTRQAPGDRVRWRSTFLQPEFEV